MGCGCKGSSGSPRRPTIGNGKMLNILQSAPKVVGNVRPNAANIMPPSPQRSASGENAEKRRVQKIRRDAIRRALGK